jgi:hypothetical protein
MTNPERRQKDWERQVALLRQISVRRVHYTRTILDLSTYREDYRSVYSIVFGLRILPLAWRSRQVQSNMVVTNGEGHNLVYLPSVEIEAINTQILESLLDEVLRADPASAGTVQSQRSAILQLGQYNVSPEDTTKVIDPAYEALERILAVVTSEKAQGAADKLRRFVSQLERSYLPFVQVSGFNFDEFTFIRHGVDQLAPFGKSSPGRGRKAGMSWKSYIVLAVSGCLRIRVQLPLEIMENSVPWTTAESLHVRVSVPTGATIWGRPQLQSIQGARSAPVSEITFPESAEHDDRTLYIYLRKEDVNAFKEKVGAQALSRAFQLGEDIKRLKERIESDQSPRPSIAHEDGGKTPEEPVALTGHPARRNPIGRKSKKTDSDPPHGLGVESLRAELQQNVADLEKELKKAESRSTQNWRAELTLKLRAHAAAYPLLALLWVAALAGAALGVWTSVGSASYGTFLSLLFLVVLTDVIYSLDKPLLIGTIVTHASATVGLALGFPWFREATLWLIAAMGSALGSVHVPCGL